MKINPKTWNKLVQNAKKDHNAIGRHLCILSQWLNGCACRLKSHIAQDFPDGSAVNTLSFLCRGCRYCTTWPILGHPASQVMSNLTRLTCERLQEGGRDTCPQRLTGTRTQMFAFTLSPFSIKEAWLLTQARRFFGNESTVLLVCWLPE